jgi:2-oxoglutarate ferredoxin oxidoreductase subunit alpha
MPANIEHVLRSYRQVVLPEMNLGQLALLLRGMFLVDVIGINQVRGLPFRVDELVGAIRAAIDGTAVRTVIGTAGRFGTMHPVPTIEVGDAVTPPTQDPTDLPGPPVQQQPVPAGTNGASR